MKPVSICFSLALLASCGNPDKEAMGERPAMPVSLQTLHKNKVRDFTEYLATMKSRQSILLQPQVDGQLTHIFVKSGDVVEPGTPLMQIDPSRQQASVLSAQASRSSHLAALNYAKQAFERAQRLYEGGAVSRQELDQARAAYESSRADGEALGAQVRQNQVQLGYYRIVAPAHGVVGDIPVRVGDHVTPATKLTTLDENSFLEAYISIPVERAVELRPDLDIDLIDNTGATLSTSKITFISPQVSEDTQSILIKTVTQNKNGQLRAAQFVRARVVWSTHDGLTIPALTVTRVNGQSFVYLAVPDGARLIARQRPVALGELVDGTYVVKSGLSDGDRLVTSGMQRLSDGIPVTAKL